MATHQQLTQEWWHERRIAFDIYISLFVQDECQAGDPQMAEKRLDLLVGVPMLEVFPDVYSLAEKLITHGPLPQKAETDALHIAVAAAHSIDYLLTWNCKHIANASMERAIGRICRESGFEPPVICTPQELLED